MNHLSVHNLTGIRGLTENDLELIFQSATEFKEVINRPYQKSSLSSRFHCRESLF